MQVKVISIKGQLEYQMCDLLQAFVQLVKMEQEEAERQYQKEQEERRRKAQEAKRKKRFLEAAFDGDNDELVAILKEVNISVLFWRSKLSELIFLINQSINSIDQLINQSNN